VGHGVGHGVGQAGSVTALSRLAKRLSDGSSLTTAHLKRLLPHGSQPAAMDMTWVKPQLLWNLMKNSPRRPELEVR
jgi:hypothetical protein